MQIKIAAIVPTRADKNSLIVRALTSMLAQTTGAPLIVIVSDSPDRFESLKNALKITLSNAKAIYLQNTRRTGYSGAVNTGLAYLATNGFGGFVALLDDDDTWEPMHLECNLRRAQETGADVVVSGLRMIGTGKTHPRELPADLRQSDFLIGNPGWQGSNTFARLNTLLKVGGFRDGLVSCNDRDLAIRMLDDPTISLAYTGEWTASWYYNGYGNTLSSWNSPSKLEGLASFWRLYKNRMRPAESKAFFERGLFAFGIDEQRIREHPVAIESMKLISD